METAKLKKFARYARRNLMEQVSAKLALALAEQNAARRESPEAVARLEKEIERYGKEQVIERVAYTWFNRFCALRFMDVKRYNRIGMASPTTGQFQPEMLAEAKMGHIDEEMVPPKTRRQVFALLNGAAPSPDPQGEAYRLLLVAACNFWHRAMPFLFERIDDYTELLMPDDLLSGNSILAYIREAMTPDTCEDVEVIGWLYQFYISEKKDEVFAGLRKNQKITPENIPAATQLFTPDWIVRYLVENSLGRLWMLNRPNSKLVEQMDYYIKPDQAETDFLRIAKPEEIKICDPACGSGHMLTYAFDLLYAIYEEEGYDTAEIPEKILTHNLYGIEIDERAGELAAFALTMKARTKQRRFFNKAITPNICVLKNIDFGEKELDDYMDFIGRDLFTTSLQKTLRQFEEADHFGSLIRLNVTDVAEIRRTLQARNVSGQLFLGTAHEKVLQALRQTDYLSPKYHVVIANPPYMTSSSMNVRLKTWSGNNYPDSKHDLFALFIERCLTLVISNGYIGMITMHSWMFISSFKNLRIKILNTKTIQSMAHIGARGFDSIGGEVVSTTAFIIINKNFPNNKGIYIKLVSGNSEKEKSNMALGAIKDNKLYADIFFRISANELGKIPGAPIGYWIKYKMLSMYDFGKLSSRFDLSNCIQPGNSEIFLRRWFEIAKKSLNDNWVFVSKGGAYRKWYGNIEFVIDYSDNGAILLKNPSTIFRTPEKYFQNGFVWSRITTGKASFRDWKKTYLVTDAGPIIYCDDYSVIGFLNSSISSTFLELINPTINYQIGNIGNLPNVLLSSSTNYSLEAIGLAKNDWDSYETSWDFTSLPLLNPDYRQPTLEATYQKLRAHWQEMTLEMKRLEEENNRICIDAYGLQDELTPCVPPEEITLTCNPYYRYSGDKSEEELERLLRADTMRELVSYAVGCMFGRYALEKPGLILANQGETFEDYLKQVPEPSFPADDDNVIPMLDGDWFADDIAERFRKFLRVAFGEAHYEENLRFVEQALNVKDRRNYSIRTYFLGEFYKDHVKRYKKRPIYWLFSSPRGSFNALIYMHRYRPDTVSVVLNDYLREFRAKLASRKNHLEAVSISADASQGEKTKALKEIENIARMIAEMEEYERDVLYPLATEQAEIDLDDGVKINYPKLREALKKIPGLSK